MHKKLMLLGFMFASFSWAQTIDEALYEKGMDGDLSAMTKIGKIYHEARDKDQAQIWLKRAALQNHAEAQYWMAMNIRYDDDQDFEMWLQKSAAQNYAPAQVELSEFYFDKMTDEDNQKAMKLLKAAVAQGDARGQMILGGFYIAGFGGIAQDLAKGKAYLEQAAAQKYITAYYYLGEYYSNQTSEQNYAEAMKWYQRMIDESQPNDYQQRNAIAQIANMYILGLGVPQDMDKAKSMLKPIMSMYMPNTLYNMGLIYAASDDEQERKKALGYLRTACWKYVQASCDKVQEILGAHHEK